MLFRSALVDLAAEVAALVGEDEVRVELAVDARYRGQSHELTVPIGVVAVVPGRVDSLPEAGPSELAVAFAARHRAFNGFDRADGVVEVIALRARATGTAPVRIEDLPVSPRPVVRGPAVVEEPDCTVWIPSGWEGSPGGGGALVLRRVGSGVPVAPEGDR